MLEKQPWRSLRALWKALPIPHRARVAATRLAYGLYGRRGLIRNVLSAPPSETLQRLSAAAHAGGERSLFDQVRDPSFWLARLKPEAIPPGDLILSAYLTDTTGIGRGGRLTLQALRAAGHAPHTHDLRHDLAGASVGRLPPGGVWFAHCNPEEAEFFMNVSDGRLFRSRYRVAYWAWELPNLPERWIALAPLFHEIWTPSAFVTEAVRRAVGEEVRVRTVPHPRPLIGSPTPDRARFGMREDAFVFLSMYDTRSSAARKNPDGAVEAFLEAFPGEDRRAQLVVKVQTDGVSGLQELEALRARTVHRANVTLIVETLSDAEADQLLASADAFVSLHRSEGFGLSIAQAMSLGRPVIATGWSGNVDFMQGAGIEIPYRLVPCVDASGRYGGAGQVWADPDLAAAASAMRRLVEDPRFRAEAGAAGPRAIAARLPDRYGLEDLRPWLLRGATVGGSVADAANPVRATA